MNIKTIKTGIEVEYRFNLLTLHKSKSEVRFINIKILIIGIFFNLIEYK